MKRKRGKLKMLSKKEADPFGNEHRIHDEDYQLHD